MIYRQHSQGYRHPYAQRHQLLDVDLSGMPCGSKAAMGTKGYFAKQRNRRGRQLGRVLATRYGEIVTDQLFAGTRGLVKARIPLVEAAEQVLDLDEDKRPHTILRIDSGGGSLADVNWALARGYKIHTKEYSRQRARKLGQSVTAWYDDPQIPGRQIGWVTTEAPEYVCPVVRIAVRWKRQDGEWEYAVVISALTAQDVIAEMNQPMACMADDQAVLRASVQSYDARGGGVETSFKDDKQGLGLTTRNKKRFAAQQIVTLLGTLAHNVIVWARGWLSDREPTMRRYGIMRMACDIFHISGFLVHNAQGQIVEVVLNQRSPLVGGLSHGLDLLLRPAHIAINWGQI